MIPIKTYESGALNNVIVSKVKDVVVDVKVFCKLIHIKGSFICHTYINEVNSGMRVIISNHHDIN